MLTIYLFNVFYSEIVMETISVKLGRLSTILITKQEILQIGKA